MDAAPGSAVSRVALVSSEPIRPRMAGIGIRYVELARRLPAAGIEVVLVSPASPEEMAAAAGEVPVRRFERGRLGGDPRRLRRRRRPGAARQRRAPRAAAPAGGDRPLRPLADREPLVCRGAGARPLPQRPRDLGPAALARRFLPLLLRGAADVLSRVPRRPRARQPGAHGARPGPRDPDRAGPLRRPRGAAPLSAAPAAAPRAASGACSSAASTTGTTPGRSSTPWKPSTAPAGRSSSSATPTPRARRSGSWPRSRRAAGGAAGGAGGCRRSTGYRPSAATTCCARSTSSSRPTGRASRRGSRCAPGSSTRWRRAARW